MRHTNSVGTGVLDGPKNRGDHWSSTLKLTNYHGRAMHAPTVKISNLFVWAIKNRPFFLFHKKTPIQRGC